MLRRQLSEKVGRFWSLYATSSIACQNGKKSIEDHHPLVLSSARAEDISEVNQRDLETDPPKYVGILIRCISNCRPFSNNTKSGC